jgi:hypothetical protein
MQFAPALAVSDAGTLAAWIEHPDCSSGNRAVAVLLGRDELMLISTGEAARHTPAAAPLGDAFAAVWLERSDATHLRLRAGARDLGALSESAHDEVAPTIASAGAHALVVWAEACGPIVNAAVVTAEGELVRRIALPEPLYPHPNVSPAAAWNGNEYLVVWERGDIEGEELIAARISSAGDLLDPEPRAVSARSLFPYLNPSIVWTGAEYLLVWAQDGAVQSQRLSRELHPIGAVETIAQGSKPIAATAADVTLIVWYDPNGALRARLVTPVGGIIAEPMLVSAADTRTRPSIAIRERGFIVTSGSPRILHVNAFGSVSVADMLPFEAKAAATDEVVVYEMVNQQIWIRVLQSDPAPRRRAVRR